jgi:hypothetical protein
MDPGNLSEKIIIDHAAIARVIVQSALMESIINAYIAEYYIHCSKSDYLKPYLFFINDILESNDFSLNAKINVLFKVFKRIDGNKVKKGDRELFNKWLRIRNICAHGKMIGGMVDGKILHGGEWYDIQSLANEFMQYQAKMNEMLSRYSKLKGRYFNFIPIMGKK